MREYQQTMQIRNCLLFVCGIRYKYAYMTYLTFVRQTTTLSSGQQLQQDALLSQLVMTTLRIDANTKGKNVVF